MVTVARRRTLGVRIIQTGNRIYERMPIPLGFANLSVQLDLYKLLAEKRKSREE